MRGSLHKLDFRGWCVTWLLAALFFVASSPAMAAERIVFIFDASGSMWGQIDGVAKIEIARQTMAELVQTIPDAAQVGLVAYGHRREGDCADIEEIMPLGPLDRAGLVAAVQGINPKGKTPMADSVRMVAQQLGTSEEQTTIILVSDGKETCNPDPCAAVQAFKQSGINFVMHVIGFDVGGEIEDQLRCMAKAGGGQYFPASNAAELGRAAQEVMELTGNNLIVSATLHGEVLPVDVSVMAAGSSAALANRASTRQDPAGFRLKPGTYDLLIVDEWTQVGRPEQRVEGVVVVDNEVREVTVSFDGGTIEVWAYSNGAKYHADVLVDDANGRRITDMATHEDRAAVFELSPGTYHVTVKDEWGSGAVVDLGEVVVEPGSLTRLKASFGAGALDVWALRNGARFQADVQVTDATGDIKYENALPDRPAHFDLVPGTYSVRVVDEWGSGAAVDLGNVEIGVDTVTLEANF
ncbi:MAG: VWA domain-containing protein [Desulfovibrionaceae bacterium]